MNVTRSQVVHQNVWGLLDCVFVLSFGEGRRVVLESKPIGSGSQNRLINIGNVPIHCHSTVEATAKY